MSGLFKRVIWIWPKWDKPNHQGGDFDSVIFQLGKTTLGDIQSREFGKTFCTCIKNLTTSKNDCTYTPINEDREKEVRISAAACDIHATFEGIVVEETLATDFLTENFQDKYIVLDIDEDYYGCTLPAQTLVDAGINMSKITDLNELLDTIICPINPDQEMKSDRILYNVLEILKSQLACERIVPNHMSCVGVARRQSAVNYLKYQIYTNKLKCIDKYYLLLRKLISRLSLFTVSQLSILQKVGFCLSTMVLPKTSYSESTFGICHGNNVPGESVVLNHQTNSSEITNRTHILQRILKTLQPLHTPITTVCRSVRDGYTPREHFRQIENDVLSSLKVLGRNKFLHYDPWLLGGKQGWYGRHDKNDNKL